MMKFPEPIDDKRRDELIEAMAKKVQQFGLIVPAIFFLEMHKPLSYLGGQAMHFFSPIIGVLFPTFEDYAYFMEGRGNVELLIQRLESMANEEEEAAKKAKKEKRLAKQAKQASMLDEALKIERDAQGSPESPKDTLPQ